MTQTIMVVMSVAIKTRRLVDLDASNLFSPMFVISRGSVRDANPAFFCTDNDDEPSRRALPRLQVTMRIASESANSSCSSRETLNAMIRGEDSVSEDRMAEFRGPCP